MYWFILSSIYSQRYTGLYYRVYTHRDILVYTIDCILTEMYFYTIECILTEMYWSFYRVYTHRDVLVGVAEHGNEHVEQDDNGDEAVGAKHELAHKLREVMLLLQLKVFDVHEAVDGKVQRLQDLKQAANRVASIT